MRRKLIAGNWKMNGNCDALAELDVIEVAAKANRAVDVAICPPFTLIERAVSHGGVAIGAQDVHAAASGAHTGCVSAAMLVEAGAVFVIVGHSERRTDQDETDAEVLAKAEAALGAGLIPIVCVGETEAERDAGRAVAVVRGQLEGSIPRKPRSEIVVAYEPVWAIGTGRTPTSPDVVEMHAAIRATLTTLLGDAAAAVRILYGGSVKPSNARDLLALDDVDGALVGGASLKAADFVPIIEAAAAVAG